MAVFSKIFENQEKQLRQMQKNQEAHVEQMMKMMEQLTKLADNSSQRVNQSGSADDVTPSGGGGRVFSIEAIESRIQEFVYEPLEDKTFELWWGRHEDIFNVDLEKWDDVQKIRLLLRHVNFRVQKMFEDSLLPKKPSELMFKEVIEGMSKMFGDTRTLFEKRKTMLSLKMSREGIEDVRAFAAKVNRTVQCAEIATITQEEMKCLVFLQGVDLPRYGDVHLVMLREAKDNPKCTLSSLLEVYNKAVELRRESRAVTEENRQVVNAVRKESKKEWQERKPFKSQKSSDDSKGSNTCFRCGAKREHKADECPFKKRQCFKCGKLGHKASLCRSEEEDSELPVKEVRSVTCGDESASMLADVEVNGVRVSMKLDTGSDLSLISEHTWRQLGKPKLEPMDCIAVTLTNSKLKMLGKFEASMQYRGVYGQCALYVTKDKVDLLGWEQLVVLDVINIRTRSEVQKWPVKSALKCCKSEVELREVDAMQVLQSPESLSESKKESHETGTHLEKTSSLSSVNETQSVKSSSCVEKTHVKKPSTLKTQSGTVYLSAAEDTVVKPIENVKALQVKAVEECEEYKVYSDSSPAHLLKSEKSMEKDSLSSKPAESIKDMLNSGVRNSVQSQSKSTSESMVCMRERTKRHGKVRSDKWKHKEFGFTVGSKFPQSVTHSSPSRSSRTELLDENSTLQEMQTPEYMEEQCILSTNETKNKRRNGKSRKT